MTGAMDEALDLVRRFEGCRLNAYRDIVGILTIGYGETLNVHEGMVWTEYEAEQALRRRLAAFMAGVIQRCPTLLAHPKKLAACTSLAYNIGLGAFGASSVCSLSKRGDFASAGDRFVLWNKAGGKVVRGLTVRRQLERAKYLEKE
jgi:lysozyme